MRFLRTPSGWFAFMLAEAAVVIVVGLTVAQVFSVSRGATLLVLVATVIWANYRLRRRLSL